MLLIFWKEIITTSVFSSKLIENTTTSGHMSLLSNVDNVDKKAVADLLQNNVKG